MSSIYSFTCALPICIIPFIRHLIVCTHNVITLGGVGGHGAFFEDVQHTCYFPFRYSLLYTSLGVKHAYSPYIYKPWRYSVTT